MATYTCPDGHSSQSDDYCDVCGLPIQASGSSPASVPLSAPAGSPPPLPAPGGGQGPSTSPLSLGTPAPAATRCPNCSTDNPVDALFCENCGYDFTTGQLPRPLAPPDVAGAQPVPPPAAPDGAVEWVAEVWVDPDWYAAQGVSDPLPSVGAPAGGAPRGRRAVPGGAPPSPHHPPPIDRS